MAVELVPQRTLRIRGLVATTALQFGHEHIGNVDESFGPNHKGHVEAVDICLLDPLLEPIGNSCGRSGNHRANAADRYMLSDFPYGPAPLRIRAGDILHRRTAGFAVHMLDDLIGIELGKIDASPARHERQRTLRIGIAAIFDKFGLRLRIGWREDHSHHCEYENFRRIPAGFRGEFSDCRDSRRNDLFGGARDENAFRMPRRKGAPGRRE